MRSRFVIPFGVLSWLSAAFAFGEDPIAVLVTGPLTCTVGERVSFEVEIVNRSGKPQQQLRVIDYFDRGFKHDASTSPIEQKGTLDLAAGTSKRITLDFVAVDPGRQCHRVEILHPTQAFVGGATACVEVTPRLSGFQPPPPAPPPSQSASTFGASSATPTVPLPSVVAPATVAPQVTVPPAPSRPERPAVPATPSLELSLQGPSEIDEGGVAKFIATVRNTGAVASAPGSLEFSWDAALEPVAGSQGHSEIVRGGYKTAWELPAIGPGEQLIRQMNFKAGVSPSFGRLGGSAGRPCVQTTLAGTGGGVILRDEACMLVRSQRPAIRTPRDAGLRISLADCDDPVRVGVATLLVCTVANEGTAPIGGLEMAITLPEQALVVGDPVPSRTRIDRSIVTFEPLTTLAPGARATFQVAYRMPIAGSWRATATATSPEIDGRVEASCATAMIATD